MPQVLQKSELIYYYVFREFNPNQPRYGILYFLRLVYSDVISFV